MIWFVMDMSCHLVLLEIIYLNIYLKFLSKVGYSKNMVEKNFSGMIKALSYGAPPHGGMAPGIDRIVMLLADEKNIREVTLFPLNQNAQDLLNGSTFRGNRKTIKRIKY